MWKRVFILLLILGICTVVYAAVDSQNKRMAIQGKKVPISDGTISQFDRYMLAGIYVSGADTGSAPVSPTTPLRYIIRQR